MNAVQIIGSISCKNWLEMRYHSCIHNTAPAKWLQMLEEVEQGGEMRTEWKKVGSDTERSLAQCVKGEWRFKGSGASGLELINLSLTLLSLRLLVYMLCGVVICCLRVFALQSVWRLSGYSSVVDQPVPHQKMPLKCPSQNLPITIELVKGHQQASVSLCFYALGYIHEPNGDTIHTLWIFMMATIDLNAFNKSLQKNI